MCELPHSPLPQSTSTKEALPVCIVQKDGAGAGEEDRKGETEGRMDNPAKRIRAGGLLAAGTTPQGSFKVFSRCLFNH